MGQEEIQKLLEITSRPLSVREIGEILGKEPCNISQIIKPMIKYAEISFLEIGKDLALKLYGCKHRMRLYFVEEEKIPTKEKSKKTIIEEEKKKNGSG